MTDGGVLRWLTAVVLVVGVAGFGAVVGAAPACACSCVQRTDRELVAGSDAVFTGTVREIRGGKWFAPPADYKLVVTIEVDAVYKGDLPRRVDVTTAPSGASCGIEFQAGDRYVVFAETRSGDGAPYQTGLCHGTERLGTKAALADELGPARSPRAGTDLAPRGELGWAVGAGLFAVALLLAAPLRLLIRSRRSG